MNRLINFTLLATGILPLIGGVHASITVDGKTADWNPEGPTVVVDPAGDTIRRGADLLSLGVTHDAHTLYLRVGTAQPAPSSQPALTVYIDNDFDPETGFAYLGRGIDATWSLPQDTGTWNFGSGSDLPRGGFLLRSAYDAATGTTELAFPLAMIPAAGWNRSIAVAILDPDSMDRIPDFGEPALIHTFTNPVRSSRPAATLQKRHPADLRILSWNVLRDAPLDDRQRERFGNVLRALQPDIVCFQELYTASTPWAIRFVDEFLPLDADQGFWTARKQSDCITVSRFPITDTVAVDNNLITEIDTTAFLGRTSWILNAHTPCCDDQEGRLRETDNFMRLLRQRMEQARESGEEPFAVFLVGDMNTGSSEREMLTMAEGLIFNTATDGPAFSPDWDGSGLTDVAALHTHDRRIDTWRSLGNRANISRLDYIFYSDSLVMPARSYVLNTRLVPASFRDANALSVLDTEGSDHLPLVADFRPLTLDPPFETTPADGSGWLADTWLGPLYHLDFPYLFSSRHGWLCQVEGTTGPGHWFYHFERGWLWLVPDFYPWAFAERAATWQIL